MQVNYLFTRLSLARLLQRHVPLHVVALPLKVEPLGLRLMWSERVHQDARHRWVRDLVKTSLSSALAAPRAHRRPRSFDVRDIP